MANTTASGDISRMAIIKAGRGHNPAEQLAIEAKLEKLNLVVDPATRQIKGAEASQLRRGEASLVHAAHHTGAADIIEFGDFKALHTRWTGFHADSLKKLYGGDDASVHQARMKSAAGTLQSMGAKLEAFKEQGYSIDRHKALAELYTKLAGELEQALSKPSLADATEKDLHGLSEAFEIYRESTEKFADSLQYGLAFDVADRSFSYAGPEDSRYAKVISTGHEIRDAHLKINKLAELFEAHPAAPFEGPWSPTRSELTPDPGRTVFDLHRRDQDGGRLELTLGLDFGPPNQYSDDVLILRYVDASGDVRGAINASTWRETSPSVVRTERGFETQDTRGIITEGLPELLKRLDGFDGLPEPVRKGIREHFSGLGLPPALMTKLEG